MADLSYIDRDLEVKVVGQDSAGGRVNYVGADANGNLQVKDYSNGPVSPGAVAAASGLAGGQFNSTLPTLTNAQQSALQLDSSGRLLVSGAGSTPGLADESAFTYGTSNQVVVGGVYQDASPTLTAGQQGAHRLTQYRALHANLRNASGVEIASDSQGTASQQRLMTATPDTTVATTALGALNAAVTIVTAGLTGVGFQVLAGTLIGTITPEISIDGGTTWFATTFYDFVAEDTVPSVTFSSSNTTKLYSIVLLGGTSNARVRVSAYTSGTANSLMRASLGLSVSISPQGAGGGSQAFGTSTVTFITPANNTVTLLLAANSARKYALVSNPSGSQLNMMIGNGGTGLTASSGIVIPAKAFYEFKGDNLWTGNIYGFMAGGAALTITEGTP